MKYQEIILRKSDDRYHANHGWLEVRHTFSFADFYDSRWVGFRDLLVLNQDIIQPGKGFEKHPHKNMEIITYLIEGELEHKDSMGNKGVIKSGQLQYMSAGSGVMHSEINSSNEATHLLQIWIKPNVLNLEPKYSNYDTNKIKDDNRLIVFASDDEYNNPLTKIRQNADIYFSRLNNGNDLEIQFVENKPNVWIQLIKGEINIMDKTLLTGDGIGIKKHENFSIKSNSDSEFLMFRLK